MSRATPDPPQIASQKQRTVAYVSKDFSLGLSLQKKSSIKILTKMRSITSLYEAINRWIASLEILTKIRIKILNYYSQYFVIF